jgi:prepilin-type processing-associated H-X9-DG protein
VEGNTNAVVISYGFNKGVHVHYQYGSLPSPAPTVPHYPQYPVRRVTAIKRTSEIIAASDVAQASNTTFSVSGWLDFTEGINVLSNGGPNSLNTESNGNKPSNQISGFWNNNTDNAVGYKPRYRHAGDRRCNFLFVDGHCDSMTYSGTGTTIVTDLKFRNVAASY